MGGGCRLSIPVELPDRLLASRETRVMDIIACKSLSLFLMTLVTIMRAPVVVCGFCGIQLLRRQILAEQWRTISSSSTYVDTL